MMWELEKIYDRQLALEQHVIETESTSGDARCSECGGSRESRVSSYQNGYIVYDLSITSECVYNECFFSEQVVKVLLFDGSAAVFCQ